MRRMAELRLDHDIRTRRIRIGHVPALILRPAGVPPVPVGILWIHGGGYISGMKEMVYVSRAADLVRKFGVTVISPGYRLAWRRPYPAAVDDCYQVLEYMGENAELLGFRSIMVGGESAGGGLAAAVCMMARDRGKVNVVFQMPLYPMISNLDTDSSRDNHGKGWDTRRNHFGWRVYLRENATRSVSPYAAPAGQADFSGLPPCYTFVGDGEPFHDETIQFVENLRAAGVEANVDVYHTDRHGFDILRPKEAVSRKAAEVFEQHFKEALDRFCES